MAGYDIFHYTRNRYLAAFDKCSSGTKLSSMLYFLNQLTQILGITK